jgi:hypothetical protein
VAVTLRATLLLAVSIPALVAAQADAQKEPPKENAKADSLVTLVGCVTGTDVSKEYHLVEGKNGAVYRLTGVDMRRYIGQRVELTGRPPKRVHIVGGLVPSPNTAAQAGAIDPPPAAAAATPAQANLPLPELRVRSIKTVSGGCPDQ